MMEKVSAGGIGAILSAIMVAAGFLYNDRLSLEARIQKLEWYAQQNNNGIKDIQRNLKSRMIVTKQEIAK